MGNRMAAEGDKTRQVIGINSVFCEIGLVHPNHAGQITSGRVPGNEDQFGVAPKFVYVAKGPRHGGRRILDVLGAFGFRKEPVIGGHHRKTLASQLLGNGFSARAKASTVKPNYGRETFHGLGTIKVQLASVPAIFAKGLSLA